MTNTLHQRWGDNLRQARERAGLSQIDLARSMGVNPSAICRAEQGKATLADENRVRAAAVLDVRVEDIWDYPATAVAS